MRRVAETASTNADLLELARQGGGEGAVLVADHQTAGRGRQGRTWEAPPGASLLVSVLLRPPAAVADAVTMVAGLAMAEGIGLATAGAVEPLLKWPNDLVVEGQDHGQRKLGGILAEADWPARSQASGGWSPPPPAERVAVVVGVGVNANWPDGVPEHLADRLISLNHLLESSIVLTELLESFLDRLAGRYDDLVAGGADARTGLVDDWRARSATLGRRVRVDLGPHDVEGLAVDVDADGRLVVDVDGAGPTTFAVGDVVHLR